MSAANDRVVLFFLTDGEDDWTELRDSFSVGHGAIPGVGEQVAIGATLWRVVRREWEIPSTGAFATSLRVRLRLAPWGTPVAPPDAP